MTDKTMTLEPCPFCGCKDNLGRVYSGTHSEYYVQCFDCDARGPVCADDNDACGAWSNRHLSQPAGGLDDYEVRAGSCRIIGPKQDVLHISRIIGEPEQPTERGEAVATRSMPPERDEVVAASLALGSWMSAALDDPSVCVEMKRDINRWFDAAMPSAPPPAVGVPEDVERDAARYRWLRTLQGDVLTKKWNGESWCDASYTELDAAIDLARAIGDAK